MAIGIAPGMASDLFVLSALGDPVNEITQKVSLVMIAKSLEIIILIFYGEVCHLCHPAQ